MGPEVMPMNRVYKPVQTKCELEVEVKAVPTPISEDRARNIVEQAFRRFQTQEIIVRRVVRVDVLPEQD